VSTAPIRGIFDQSAENTMEDVRGGFESRSRSATFSLLLFTSLYLDLSRGIPQSVSPKVIPHNALPSESSILATQPTGLPDLAR